MREGDTKVKPATEYERYVEEKRREQGQGEEAKRISENVKGDREIEGERERERDAGGRGGEGKMGS